MTTPLVLAGASDVDIGLRTKPIDRMVRVQLEADLERLVQRTCDFTDLDEAPPQLRFEIVAKSDVRVWF